MKLSYYQWHLLNACASRPQRSTAVIQNTTRALVRLGLIERVRDGDRRILLQITDAGRKEWFVQMQERKARKHVNPARTLAPANLQKPEAAPTLSIPTQGESQ